MSPQSDNPDVPTVDVSIQLAPQFNLGERRQLLALAHEAILSVVENRELPLEPTSGHFTEPRGAFTTLYFHNNLRGCVGYAMPIAPLYRTVIETARGAAFEDTRFPPVTFAQAGELEVSLSILSRLKPARPEEVEIGTHGLLISQNGHRGLLLPQVPLEHGWDRDTFLRETCRKAGLPVDAWRSDAEIEVFTAEIFGDSDLG